MEKIDQNKVPKRKFYTGEEIPAVGLGTFGSDKYGPEAISEAVYGAIKFGYRLIDCAAVYQNEAQIGQVLKRLFDEGVVERKDLFITSKVWNDMHEKVGESCRQSLKDLGLETIDLFFVHWPFPNYHAPGCSGDSRNPDSRPFSVEEFMKTWRQCEELVDQGLVRYIGMSNMTVPKLEAVLPLCRIKPAALEMELHPSFQQPKLFRLCSERMTFYPSATARWVLRQDRRETAQPRTWQIPSSPPWQQQRRPMAFILQTSALNGQPSGARYRFPSPSRSLSTSQISPASPKIR